MESSGSQASQEPGAPDLSGILGQTIGGYQIERVLSAGATNATLIGNHPAPPPVHSGDASAAGDDTAVITPAPETPPSALPDTAAITLLNPPWPLDATGRAALLGRLRAEVETAQRQGDAANAHHLVAALAAGDANGAPYLVLPAPAGSTLTGVLGAGPLPLAQAVAYLAQLADALDELHRRGIFHGDLNPANVWLDATGQAQLANAGIIPLLQGSAPDGAGLLLGLPTYMAPERFAGYPTTAASDIYSLGVLLYQMVTGHVPFYSADFGELSRQQQTQPPAPPQSARPDLPPLAAAAILQALDKQPAQRFASAGTLAQAFAAGLTAQPATSLPQAGGVLGMPGMYPMPPQAPWATTPPAPPKRGPGGWVVAAIAGVVVVAIVALLVGRQVLPTLIHPGAAATATSTIARGPSPTATPSLAQDQTFKYNLPTGGSGDIATLDPDIMTDSDSITVANLIYDGLVELDQNLNVEQWAARSIDVSSDGLTYTFHLQPNQQFANGTPVTAQDYAFSMNRALSPCLASPVAYYLFELKDAPTFVGETCHNGVITNGSKPVISTLIGDSIVTPDDLTLVLTLARPAAYFLEALTYPTSWALDPAVVGPNPTSETWLDTLATGVGTSGMYQVQTWDHAGGSINLVPNPHWWGLAAGKNPHLTAISFTLFKDSDTAYAAYQSGQFNVGFPTTQLLAQAQTQPDFHEVGTLTYYGLNVNWQKPPFNNVDARTAACLAINRDALNSSILKGSVIPHWNIVPKGMPGYNPNITGPDGVTSTAGDQSKAASHWQTYLSTPGAVKSWTYLYVASSTSSKQLAEALQNMWQQTLGVTVTLKGEDFNTWLQDSNAGNYTATRFGWLDDYPDPQDFLTLLFSSTAQYNSQKASVPQADTLMAAADAENDQTQRLQNYNQAEQLLVNAVATCPLYQGQDFYQVRQCVHNWSQNASAMTVLDSWVNTYIDPSCPNT